MLNPDKSSEARTAENTYAKATKAELARNYDEAFKLYVQATESFLHLSRTTHHSETLCTKWKTNAAKALERAEKIKAFAQRTQVAAGGDKVASSANPNRTADVRLTPIGINHFSSQEQYYVLKRGSQINGLTFPLWDEPQPQSSSTANFRDSDGQPPLSTEQHRVSTVWRHTAGINFGAPRTYKLSPEEILQHVVTDCSVCASISVCLEHARRFGSDLARSALHSACGVNLSLEDKAAALSLVGGQNADEGGRYDVKMFVNGAWRRVFVDDALPYNPSDGSLMCMTVKTRDGDGPVYWPSLIEKSYMKLMGGYDFPGSNSSIDLHAITGWIPEQIDTKSPSFEREGTWDRLVSGFRNGQCLVTLGTGPRSGIRWRDVPLLESHSYAVIDIAENEEDRLFTVLDSWVRPEEEQCSRVLQIPWSEVLYVFDGIYLSWDPGMWKRRIDFHGMWKRGSNQEDEDVNHNLRLNFVNANSETDEEIWILLTRHLRDTRRTSDFICLRAELENPNMPLSRIHHQQHQVSDTGTYTNSTHVLMRTRIPSSYRSGTFGVTVSYEGEKDVREVGFDVVVYSGNHVQVAWDESTSPPPYSTKVEGTLTDKNAGGNCMYPTFMVNPQYHLRIHPAAKTDTTRGSKKSKTKVVLRTAKGVPVNVVVVWSKGDRKFELDEQEVASTSGAYTYGLAQAIKDLLPGDYTLIVSAFEPYHTGTYTLKVECSNPFDLKSIPQEGSGLRTKIVKDAWDASCAVGGPTFQKYARNPRFEFTLPTSGQIKIRLQLLEPSKVSSAALNVAVFHSTKSSTPTSPSRAYAGPVLTSGTYSDSLAGVVTPLVMLSQGTYEIIPSTYSPGIQTAFRLIMYLSVSGVEVRRIQSK